VITPELKALACSDLDPIETWVPGDDEVIYWLTLVIGLPGSPAANDFQVCVATPAGLRSPTGRRMRPRGSARPPPIVLQAYSWAGVLGAIQQRLDACAGSDWSEIADKLRRQFAWEYEGMR
jgi:hypothetical protein